MDNRPQYELVRVTYAPYGQYQQIPPKPPTNGLAIASMIIGIVSMVMCCIGGIFGIVGLILGIVALQKPGGHGMAITGIVTSSLSVLVSLIGLVI